MGQKVRPTGFRLGITESWKSKWYAAKKEFSTLLGEDLRLRKYILNKYQYSGIPRIDIERTRDQVIVHLHTARPGIIIGRKGQEVDKLKAELEEFTGRRMDLKIVEVAQPARNAILIAEDIAQQLLKRTSFRRAIKKSMDTVMESGAFGVKVELSGRLGGAEMSRTEKAIRGSIPLSTILRNIDYGFAVAKTAQGTIGCKVWIDNGPFTGVSADGANAEAGQAPQKPKRSHKR